MRPTNAHRTSACRRRLGDIMFAVTAADLELYNVFSANSGRGSERERRREVRGLSVRGVGNIHAAMVANAPEIDHAEMDGISFVLHCSTFITNTMMEASVVSEVVLFVISSRIVAISSHLVVI